MLSLNGGISDDDIPLSFQITIGQSGIIENNFAPDRKITIGFPSVRRCILECQITENRDLGIGLDEFITVLAVLCFDVFFTHGIDISASGNGHIAAGIQQIIPSGFAGGRADQLNMQRRELGRNEGILVDRRNHLSFAQFSAVQRERVGVRVELCCAGTAVDRQVIRSNLCAVDCQAIPRRRRYAQRQSREQKYHHENEG